MQPRQIKDEWLVGKEPTNKSSKARREPVNGCSLTLNPSPFSLTGKSDRRGAQGPTAHRRAPYMYDGRMTERGRRLRSCSTQQRTGLGSLRAPFTTLFIQPMREDGTFAVPWCRAARQCNSVRRMAAYFRSMVWLWP